MINYNFDQEFYLTKNSKDITEITHSELCLMKHLLKQELGIISSSTRYNAIQFLIKTELLTEYLDDYLHHTTVKTKLELNDVIGSYRTLLDTFCLTEKIPFSNKQHELFNKQ